MDIGKGQMLKMLMDDVISKTVMKIDEKLTRKFQSKKKRLGWDWSFVGHSANAGELLRQLKREIKGGFQRFARGYDDQMFWNLDSYLDELIMISLEWYIKHRSGSPILDEWIEENCHEKFTEKLKKMLNHFEQADDRWCKEKNKYEDIVDLEWKKNQKPDECGYYTVEYEDQSPEAEELRDKWLQRGREIDAYQAEHHKRALEMLVKYYKHLWD